MLVYPQQVKPWEQYDLEYLLLQTYCHMVSTTHPPLVKTHYSVISFGFCFRSYSQPNRSNCRKSLLRQQLIVLHRQVKQS
jgi:hypothetical protein